MCCATAVLERPAKLKDLVSSLVFSFFFLGLWLVFCTFNFSCLWPLTSLPTTPEGIVPKLEGANGVGEPHNRKLDEVLSTAVIAFWLMLAGESAGRASLS